MWVRMSETKMERLDESLIEKFDISFALTIDVHVILSKQRWMIRNSKIVEQSHDEVYGCLKGDSGNSGGKRLAISMVEDAWLSEKEDV
ncbi:hypothetical protein Tco_0726542 [Tanacetum coccineum]|uniref:DUF4283 domain-containing protein n=1 Tax=Tanacetum coccineum TaxID=301880 RepID=A0ABQ4YGY4_9ASTR